MTELSFFFKYLYGELRNLCLQKTKYHTELVERKEQEITIWNMVTVIYFVPAKFSKKKKKLSNIPVLL